MQLAQAVVGTNITVERVPEGVSTIVYRLRRRDACFYLRVLPEVDASFAPEVYVHHVLRERGLHIPKVIYFEHRNAVLERSVMITTEITGLPIGYGAPSASLRMAVRQAGREQAVINSVLVQGFGWINRMTAQITHLRGEYDDYATWLQQEFSPMIAALGVYAPLAAYVSPFKDVMEEAVALFGADRAVLAHGDFDPTHIFHRNGAYTGIIDFGEIRGAQPLYDLGHFTIEHGELLPDLLEGYAEIAALPSDYRRRIDLAGLLIAAYRVGRRVIQHAEQYQPYVQFIQQSLNTL